MNGTNPPLVSVIIPAYNRGADLTLTVESALRQTCSAELELIIVDDASSDSTYEVAFTLSDDPRVRVIRHEVNSGVSAALNTGLRAARGEYIAILEHDDIWLPDKLARQLPLFSNRDVGLVYCGVFLVNSDGSVIRRVTPEKRGDIYRSLLFKNYIVTSSSVVLRRSCLEKVGLFDLSLNGPQDYDLWIRLARYYQIDFVAEALVKFAFYPRNNLSRPAKMLAMYGPLIKKFETYEYSSALLRRQVFAYRHYEAGNAYACTADMPMARQMYRQSLDLWPFNLKCLVSWAFTLCGSKFHGRLSRFRERGVQWRDRLSAVLRLGA